VAAFLSTAAAGDKRPKDRRATVPLNTRSADKTSLTPGRVAADYRLVDGLLRRRRWSLRCRHIVAIGAKYLMR
jgi:hypothetical protein